jgi:hypothetical protein
MGRPLYNQVTENLMLKVVEAHPMDAIYLASRLRDIDDLEVRATGKTPEEALMHSFDMPKSRVYTGVNQDEEPVLMFGSVKCPHNDGVGIVWLLATNKLDDHKRDFLSICPENIDLICEGYKFVYNFVHKDNKKSIRWLRWSGFTVDTSKTYDQGGEDFYLLSKEI